MSVITTRTSVLSILKVKGDNKPSPHRVRFKLPSNVRQIFIDKKNHVNTKDYENLVCTIRDSEITDVDLKKLLEEAKNCVALLDYDLRLFVQALVILGWTHRSPNVVHSYSDFIMTVVSAHPQHSKDVMDQLVRLFTNCDVSEWTDDNSPCEVDATHFANLHSVLKSILKTIPLTSDILIALLKKNFPYHTMSPDRQKAYMYNTLKVMDYMPQERKEILRLYVDRLLNLDVHAPREDIEDENLAREDQFQMDDVKSSSVAKALDIGMCLLFRYFDTTCRTSNGAGDLKWLETKALFADLLEVLDKSLLSTYGTSHVQFILFYFVSFKTSLAQAFLNALWKKVLSPTVPAIVRKMSVYYVASFLARANFIPSGFLKTYLCEMTTWVHRYISNQDTIVKPNREIRAHGVFYAVCQSIFYVIAFRHRDLVESKKRLAFLQSLNISKIVTSSLNPLRVCVAPVVDNFAAVARDHQLAYCYTIMENNKRCYLQQPIPEAFFPFDPYILERSSQYITPLYMEYSAGPDVAMEGSGADRTGSSQVTDDEDMDEEDEFIAEHPTTDKQHNFSYSTSPGFKQKSA